MSCCARGSRDCSPRPGSTSSLKPATPSDLLRKGLAHRPSVVIADVNMPPGHGDDGLRAAIELRRQRPETGVLVLSQYYEEHYALDLIGERADGVGYLLKERVGDVESSSTRSPGSRGAAARLTRRSSGGCSAAVTATARLTGSARASATCWPRWRRASPTMAIAQALLVSQAAVEKHVTSIFHKLELDPAQTEHRRVLAVLAYLRDPPSG